MGHYTQNIDQIITIIQISEKALFVPGCDFMGQGNIQAHDTDDSPGQIMLSGKLGAAQGLIFTTISHIDLQLDLDIVVLTEAAQTF